MSSLDENQITSLKQAIEIADAVMEQSPSQKLAEGINLLQEVVEGK